MAQNRLSISLIWIQAQLAFAGCLFFVSSSGISAESTKASTAGSENQVRVVTRASGLTEPLFGTYHVSQQHQIKPGNAFYPSIANLNGTLYVIQGSHNSLFIHTLDPKTFEPGEATEVWNTQKDTGDRKLTYPPGVNDIRAFDGKLYFSTTCAWDARAEGLSKNAGLVALLFSYDPKIGPASIKVIERLAGAQDMDMTIWNDQLWVSLVQGDPQSKDPDDLFGHIELRPLTGDRLGRGIRWDSREHGLELAYHCAPCGFGDRLYLAFTAFHRPSQGNLWMLESDGKTFGNLRIIEGDQFDEHQGLSCYAHMDVWDGKMWMFFKRSKRTYERDGGHRYYDIGVLTMGPDRVVSPTGLLVADDSYNSGPNPVVWKDSLFVVLEKISEAYFAPWNGSRIGTWSLRIEKSVSDSKSSLPSAE